MNSDREKKKIKMRFAAGGIVLVVTLFLFLITKFFKGIASWYSSGIYPLFVNTAGRIWSIVPFSAIEILIYLGILCCVFFLIRFLIQCLKRARYFKLGILTGLSRIFLFAASMLLIYMLTCGMNYYRASFAEINEMEEVDYSGNELIQFAEHLTEKLNGMSYMMERDQNGISVLGEGTDQQAVTAMEQLGEDYPELAGYYPRPKFLMVSQILSYQHLSGIYSPFTLEANYNKDMTGYNIPHTMCHELAHLKGFMQEEEANYIAYLACISSEEVMFQYSGLMAAWIHTMNAVWKESPAKYEEIYGRLYSDVEADLKSNREFWKEYDGKTAEFANKVNDTYLKANSQSDGVKSYGKVVDLLMADYMEEIKEK